MPTRSYQARVEKGGTLKLPKEAQEELNLQTGDLIEISVRRFAGEHIKAAGHNAKSREKILVGMGMFAHVPGSSEEFAREKQAEIAREDQLRN